MHWLIIRSAALDSPVADYALLDGKQEKAQWRKADWPQLASIAKQKRVILLLPSEDVFATTLSLPTTNARQLAKAIPFAIEEMVAEDIDELHIVHRHDKSSGKTHVAAIRAALLESWQDHAQQHGLQLHALLADVYALPVDEHGETLLIQDGRCLLRNSALRGHVFPADLAPQLLPELLDQHKPQLLFDNTDNNPIDMEWDSEKTIQQQADLHQYCHGEVLSAMPLNLLHGYLREGQSNLADSLKPWRAVAGLAIACGVLWLVMTGWQNHQLEKRLAELDGSIAGVFSQTFPGVRVDSDYRVNHATMAERLKALDGKPESRLSALMLLHSIAPTLKKNQQIEVKNLQFKDQRFSLALKAPSDKELEILRAALDKGQIDAQIESSTTSADKVEAIMSIKLDQSS